jgi:hypothetical protein
MKKMIGAILGVALLCALLFAIRHPPQKLVAANTVFTKAGTYRSPSGSHVVRVLPENDGSLKFVVTNEKSNGPNGIGPAMPFQARSDWFMCWDSKDRLWTYVPEQDNQYCCCWYSSEEGSGSCLVGEFGGWEGIPNEFFARLPKTVKATYTTYAAIRAQQSSEPKKQQPADTQSAN